MLLNLKGGVALRECPSNCKHIGFWSEIVETKTQEQKFYLFSSKLDAKTKRSGLLEIPEDPDMPFH